MRESIRKAVQEIADELNLNVAFSLGRRETDIVVIHLKGKRKRTLALPTYVLDIFPDVDIEFIRSASTGSEHTLTVVVTQKLMDQPIEVQERRAKLRLMLAQASEMPSLHTE